MEQLFSHNRVKTVFTTVMERLVEAGDLGYVFGDRAVLSNVAVGLSTEPDATFVAHETLDGGRVRLVEGKTEGYVAIDGTAGLVLEVVSRRSVQKDTVDLRELYYAAGIPEYWLVDARQTPPLFEILRRGARGYVAVRARAGWLKSAVFGRAFRLRREQD